LFFSALFGLEMQKVTRDWWKLYSVGLHNLCFATNIVKVNGIKEGEMDRDCSTNLTDEK
jgi:hypothetical protein